VRSLDLPVLNEVLDKLRKGAGLVVELFTWPSGEYVLTGPALRPYLKHDATSGRREIVLE